MRLSTQYCENCGEKYVFKWSGSDTFEVPKEYRDEKYCPCCKKLIVDALAKVPKKTEIRWIKTDTVDLETILSWEEQKINEYQEKIMKGELMFPIAKKVFAEWANVAGEYSISGEITKEDKTYRYRYWPNKLNEAIISIKCRIDLRTNEIVSYY